MCGSLFICDPLTDQQRSRSQLSQDGPSDQKYPGICSHGGLWPRIGASWYKWWMDDGWMERCNSENITWTEYKEHHPLSTLSFLRIFFCFRVVVSHSALLHTSVGQLVLKFFCLLLSNVSTRKTDLRLGGHKYGKNFTLIRVCGVTVQIWIAQFKIFSPYVHFVLSCVAIYVNIWDKIKKTLKNNSLDMKFSPFLRWIKPVSLWGFN